MRTKESNGCVCGILSAEESHKSVVLFLAGNYENDALCGEDAVHTHSDSVARNVVAGLEEAGVSIDGALAKGGQMGSADELFAGLVEADMAIASNAEKLNTYTACCCDLCIVFLAESIGISALSVGNEGVCLVNVDVIEKTIVHKIAIALLVGGFDGIILVKVIGLDAGEIDLAGLVILDKAGIDALGGRTGCKSENAGGILSDIVKNTISCVGYCDCR